MLKRLWVCVAIALALASRGIVPTSGQEAPEYGPAQGALVIAGGGELDGSGILEKFITLGGGPDNGRFVVVPTARGNRTSDGSFRQYKAEEVLRAWKARGLAHVAMLHTADPEVADTEAFVENLREATAVWFVGGRQWNIVDSYADTLREFHKVLARGGVIGGTSAGATIQGQYLVRGDTSGADVMMTKEANHQHGFAFLRRSAIDQHINTRKRWDDLVPVIRSYPDLLGIGLSERTAIVVTGDTFEVLGAWKVAIHDNMRMYQPWEKPYYVLSAGDAYDMKARRIIRLHDGSGDAQARLLKDRKSVTKAETETFVNEHRITLEERVLGEPGGETTQCGQFQFGGPSENCRQILVKLPLLSLPRFEIR